MHSEGYLLISNVVYTNQIGFCFKQLSVEENQFQDAMTAILHAEDPLQTYQMSGTAQVQGQDKQCLLSTHGPCPNQGFTCRAPNNPLPL